MIYRVAPDRNHERHDEPPRACVGLFTEGVEQIGYDERTQGIRELVSIFPLFSAIMPECFHDFGAHLVRRKYFSHHYGCVHAPFAL
jgi:hypothetical protein